MKAIWNGKIVAESNETIEVLGNHYFPPNSIKREFFKNSETTSECKWKGTATYYSLEVNGQENKDAAWYYPRALEKAKNIQGYFAFWKGVKVR